jgi:hypothetical protein
MNHLVLRICCIGLLASLTSSSVFAQTLGVGQKLPQQQQLKTGSITPQNVAIAVNPLPPADVMLGLIRTTIVAVNQANQTGNYTVLRDLGAPDFRNANDASRLAAIFQVLREQGIDFTPLLQIPPEVSEAPAIDASGLMRLTGFFPTEPLRVNFDMSFQIVNGGWRPYTISVYLARVEVAVQPPVLTKQGIAKPNPAAAVAAKTK